MSRLFGLLHQSRTAMTSQQLGLQTAGHNVSNVNTPGYTRQRIDLYAQNPTLMRGIMVGNGVRVGDVAGVRNVFVEGQLIGQEGALGFATARQAPLNQVDAFFNELRADGIHDAMVNLFDTLHELTTDPSSLENRSAVQTAAQTFVDRARSTAVAMQRVRSGLDIEVQSTVDTVNRLTAKIASLNSAIAQTESGGAQASDLRDARYVAIRELSGLIDVRAFEDDRGRVSVIGPAGRSLVDGDQFGTLRAIPDPTSPEPDPPLQIFYIAQSGENVDITNTIQSGALGGLVAARDTDLTQIENRLDEFVFAFVSEMNNQHRQGVGLDGVGQNHPNAGDPGRDMFVQPAVATRAAATLALDSDFATNVDVIAAAADQANLGLPGDNRNALALVAVQYQDILDGNSATGGEFYSRLVRDAGALAQNNRFNLELEQGKRDQLDQLREQTSGVSIDEELVDLIKYENAFDASARVIRATDELLDTVLDLTR